MDGYRTLPLLLGLAGLVTTACSSCAWLRPAATYDAPPVFSEQPTLERVIQVVNQNSSQIHKFSADRATLSGPGIPTLRASIDFQRPRGLRLRAETGLVGPEIDLGSNEDLFWIWIRRDEPKALYYCRHQDFASSPVRQTFPIDPDWLIEALGVTELDPALAHQGPVPMRDGRLQVRTVIDSPDGPSTKVTIVDGRTGLVWVQRVYDASGQLVASAVTQSHRQDPLTGVVMPRVVDVTCPKADLSMRVNLGNVEVNRPETAHPELFAMPSYDGWPNVNLCDPTLRFGPPPGGVASRPGPAAPVRAAGPRFRF